MVEKFVFDQSYRLHEMFAKHLQEERKEMTLEKNQQLWDKAASEVLECEVKNYHYSMARGAFYCESEIGELGLEQSSAKAIRITHRKRELQNFQILF